MGLSNRAPHFAALPQRPQILTAPPVQAAAVTDQSDAPRDDADYALLGGPDDGAIRPRRASLY